MKRIWNMKAYLKGIPLAFQLI